MARTRFSVTRTTYNPDGSVLSTTTRHGLSTDALTCSQQEAAFAALLQSAKLASTGLTPAAAATGKHWESRSCGDTVDTRPFCTLGPTVTNLTVNSATSMLVLYDGVGLTSIDWKIEQAGSPVRNGNSGNLTTNTFPITLTQALPAGNYELVLDGTVCKTTNPTGARRAFTVISGTTTPAAPTVVNPMGTQTVTQDGEQTILVPSNTYTGTGSLTWSGAMQSGSFPSGLSFNVGTHSFIVGAGLPNGNYAVKTTVTDSFGQSISNPFTITLNRTTTTPQQPGEESGLVNLDLTDETDVDYLDKQ